ncbi:DNA repair photolyase domain protein [Janthinobacterium agaricidamnosum NBRC 102515 = DSM 9628]|uniref:DNA repair photolyase domain protein n=1 Tax=Janthinobacterium agaricidamnosum NBRC 102515 = DSM 9628 TaxID=1349767 RepID=W0V9K3_9BURK|nr:DNA repair photolyase domain protein [Janthinobacterium agaricidamnosum NBRC 102515 = DSM 9628]
MSDYDEQMQGQVMLPPPSLKGRKGRGAVSNLQGRYEIHGREGYDDGWAQEDENADGKAIVSWKTQVTEEYAKTILTRNASPDLPFSVSLNPYRGCEHEM